VAREALVILSQVFSVIDQEEEVEVEVKEDNIGDERSDSLCHQISTRALYDFAHHFCNNN